MDPRIGCHLKVCMHGYSAQTRNAENRIKRLIVRRRGEVRDVEHQPTGKVVDTALGSLGRNAFNRNKRCA